MQDEILARLDRLKASLSGPPVEYLDNARAAAFLELQPKTLEIWRTRREGPPFLKIGKIVRYAITDLRAYMEAHRQKPFT